MEGTLIGIASTIILLQLGIIGYFISKDNRKQEVTNEKTFKLIEDQHKTNEELVISINSLNTLLQVMNERFEGLKKSYEDHKLVCKYLQKP